MKIYVGNLPRAMSEDELRNAFAAYGEVSSVAIIKDKFSGESRGFGFIEMSDATAAQKALAELNGKDFGGRKLNVSEARPKPEGSRGGGGGSGGGGGGGGRGRW